ncbi:MAG: restriction endonuclease subunit S [Pedobacter sp.]|nr:MAG: restriction endonuclease subunit S [Pedobacter sp.]
MSDSYKMTELGKIPETWEVVHLNDFANILNHLRVPLSSEVRSNRKGKYPYCGANGIVDYIDDYKFDGVYVLMAEDGGNFHVYQTRPIAYLMCGKFWVNNHAHVLSAKNGLNRFLLYSLEHKDITRYIIGSTRTKLNRSVLESIPLAQPSFEEQRRIEEILSTVDEKIDVIEAQITQTQELKRGLMQRLLTKGIGHTQFKASPLGEIPESWDVVLLDKVARRGSGHTPNKNHPEYYNGEIKWISLADSHRLDRRWISASAKTITEAGINNSSAVLHPGGTVILSRDAGIGKSAVMVEPMAVSQHFITWTVSECLNNWFLYYYLQFNKALFERIAIGSTIKTIGLPFFKKFQIPLPPVEEQNRIANLFFTLDDKIDLLKEKSQGFRELKRGLMQQLLTGKLRVNKTNKANEPTQPRRLQPVVES